MECCGDTALLPARGRQTPTAGDSKARCPQHSAGSRSFALFMYGPVNSDSDMALARSSLVPLAARHGAAP